MTNQGHAIRALKKHNEELKQEVRERDKAMASMAQRLLEAMDGTSEGFLALSTMVDQAVRRIESDKEIIRRLQDAIVARDQSRDGA